MKIINRSILLSLLILIVHLGACGGDAPGIEGNLDTDVDSDTEQDAGNDADSGDAGDSLK